MTSKWSKQGGDWAPIRNPLEVCKLYDMTTSRFFFCVLSNWQDDLLPEKQCSAMFCLYRVNMREFLCQDDLVPSTTASIKTFESCTMYTIIFYSISCWVSRSISLDSAPLPHGSPGPMCFCHQRLRPEAILEKLGDERGTVAAPSSPSSRESWFSELLGGYVFP